MSTFSNSSATTQAKSKYVSIADFLWMKYLAVSRGNIGFLDTHFEDVSVSFSLFPYLSHIIDNQMGKEINMKL